MKTLSLIICILILIPPTVFGKEWLVDKKIINLGCNCELISSSILSNLGDSCSEGKFELTDQGLKVFYKNPSFYVVSSWKEFLIIKDKLIVSPFFDNISKNFFNNNRLAVVLISYTGSSFIKNEQLQSINQKCSFSYDIWDKTVDEIPVCEWISLYVLKLKK